jgi:ubiquitin-conjugating enzyme E2 D/E
MAQEFAGISADPPPGCVVKLAQEGDLHLWDVYMDGPADSPYKVRLPLNSQVA